MQWNMLPIELSSPSEAMELHECIFFFDLNKLAYVCYIESKDEGISDGQVREILEKRQGTITKTVSEYVKEEWNFRDIEFLTMYLIPENNQRWSKLLPSPKTRFINTFFTLDELKYICNTEESDPLTLWKFAKSYTEAITLSRINSKGGNLAVFAGYLQNNCCIWPEDEIRPDIIDFRPLLATRYIERSNERRKEHKAKFRIDGEQKEISVYNYCDYAPFYREVEDTDRNTILLEEFLSPIWFTNDQEETQHSQLISSQLEMLAFWIHVLEPDLKENFTLSINDTPIIVKVIIDSRFKPEMRPRDILPEKSLDKIQIPITINGSDVEITIPLEMANWYSKSDNQGERHVVFHFLNSILNSKKGNKAEVLKVIIDERIPIGIAKMSSMLGNAKNILMESRHMTSYRKVQPHDVSEIQINLTRAYGIKVDDTLLKTKEGRKKICRDIAAALHGKLIKDLKEYDGMHLLPVLLNYHEACVREKAIKQLDRPARVALFGADAAVIYKEHMEENERTKTALTVRCLVEQIVAYNMVEGDKLPNFDDIDKLIALMSELISWANLSDGIHLDLYDPEMKLLPCGRIDVDYPSINSTMFTFGINRTQIELDQYDSGYVDLFTMTTIEKGDEYSPEVKEVEDAFFAELGMSFLRLHDFLTDLVELVRRNNSSTISIDEEILYEELRKTKFNWTDSEIRTALDYFVLLQGWQIDNPPKGYRKTDTRPWYYNRALSFNRRPIAKLVKGGRTYYTWSYRHLYASFENIYVLMTEGILWNPSNGSISQLVKKYADRKGDEFRGSVLYWLKKNSGFEVFEEEVDIKPGAKLNAKENEGDIDILMVDHTQKVVYSLECKNTAESKSVHDFKADLDKYIEPGGKEYIRKHVDRDAWLKSNIKMLNVYVKNVETYQILSVVITAFDIPLSYSNLSPLPIISFPRLKIEGIDALKELLIK
ncbi:MAG: hypothetical protein JNK50_01120 [Bacteroidia bacterium]|nr:hypothetical protein [Bacteroidia bacterium]